MKAVGKAQKNNVGFVRRSQNIIKGLEHSGLKGLCQGAGGGRIQIGNGCDSHAVFGLKKSGAMCL